MKMNKKEELMIKYLPGLRLRMIKMEDKQPVPPGTVGTVKYVDDAGSIHMNWDNGSGLAIVPEVDDFEIVDDEINSNYEFEYKDYGSNGTIITGIKIKSSFLALDVSERVVILPRKINGKRVLNVKENAFADIKVQYSIYIMAHILSIPNGCFKNSHITRVYISDKVTGIGEAAFFHCGSLISVYGNKIIDIKRLAFDSCFNLKYIYIPEVRDVGYNAFFKCSELKYFNGFNSAFLRHLDMASFAESGLENVCIKSRILRCIPSGCFGLCKNLKKVDMKSVFQVGTDAFAYCNNLKSIRSESSITIIEAGAFCGCSSLANIDAAIDISVVKTRTFENTPFLSDLSLPECKRIEDRAFTSGKPKIILNEHIIEYISSDNDIDVIFT